MGISLEELMDLINSLKLRHLSFILQFNWKEIKCKLGHF